MEAKECLDSLVNRVWSRKVERNPTLQLKQGIAVKNIPQGSLEETEEDQDFAKDAQKLLKQINKEKLPYADQLTYAFLQEHLLQDLKKVNLWWADFPVTPYTLYWMNTYAHNLFSSFTFQKKCDLDHYVQLLSDYGNAIEAVRVKLEGQAQRGWFVPSPALPKIITLIERLGQTIPLLLKVSQARLQRMDTSVGISFSNRVDTIVETQVVKSFQKLLSYLKSHGYQRFCPEQVGIGQFPGGEEAYRDLVRLHVTYDIEPEKIHTIGIEQVMQLTEKMKQVRESLGFHGSEAQFIAHLKIKGYLHAKSPDEVEQRYQHHLERIHPFIHQYFSTIPNSPYQVKRLDAAFEEGVAYGYFDPPSDTNRFGTYFYNGSGLETRSQLTAATLIYHEIIPGHHLQIALQHENQNLPLIRRESMEVTGYIEGWAEYGAGLALEMGLYDDPFDLYGRLLHERFIAQRLVVDTGMNLLGWSLQQGKHYMANTTIESTEQIEAETLRYSTESPAQALAYRLGYLKFMELREKTQKALGKQFDIRAFHEAILSPGSLPLSVLEDHAEVFINNQLSQMK